MTGANDFDASAADPGAQVRSARAAGRARPVVVLGMHRSGTSALCGLLEKLGCDPPATPMAASAYNTTGYYESRKIYQLHREILTSAGSSWDDWLPVPPDWFDTLQAIGFRGRAARLLDEEFGDARLPVLKDPRICRLVPFWKDVFDELGMAPRFVLTHRNPLDVAASLERRNAMDRQMALLLWLRHLLDAEAGTRGAARSFVSYARLLSDWRGVATRIEHDLGLRLTGDPRHLDAEVAAFLSTDLRHFDTPPGRVHEDRNIAHWIRDVFSVFETWAGAGESVADHATLDRIRSEFTNAGPIFAPLIGTGRKPAKALREARRETARLAEERDDLKFSLERAVSEREETRRALSAVQAGRDHAEARVQTGIRELAELTRLLDSAETRLSREKKGARRAKAEARKLRQQIKTMKREEIEPQRQRADQAEHAVAALRSSTSWRVSAPVRVLARLFRRRG